MQSNMRFHCLAQVVPSGVPLAALLLGAACSVGPVGEGEHEQEFASVEQALDGDSCELDAARLPGRDNPTWSCLKASSISGCVQASDLQAWSGHRCLELDTHATLCSGSGTFDMTLYASTSGVVFDGNGQVIRPTLSDGVRFPYAYSVADVVLHDFIVDSPNGYGINVKRFFRGAELAAPLVGHQRISIEDVTLLDNPNRCGIFVGQASRDVSIRRSEIEGFSGGIYLEASSVRSHISDVEVRGTTAREAISVDSSTDNVIEHSLFAGNQDSIRLYRNCGEPIGTGQVCPERRPLGASRNVIRDNDFYDDVYVAERQFQIYGPGRCVDIDLVGFWRDSAKDNQVYRNRFHGVKLDIQDGPITLQGNEFLADAELEVGIGEPLGFIGAPVVVEGDVAGNIFAPGSSLHFVKKDAGLSLYSNWAASGSCLTNASEDHCEFGPSTMLGNKVASMGIWAVVL